MRMKEFPSESGTPPRVRVAVIHDDPAVRAGIDAAIAQAADEPISPTRPSLVLTGAASTPGRLDSRIAMNADVLIAGHDLPGSRGPELIRWCRQLGIHAGVVFLVKPRDAGLVADLLDAGACDAVVMADDGFRTLMHVIRRQAAWIAVSEENRRLHEELLHSLVEVEVKNAELERMVGRLEQSIRTDELTGLSSRRWLDTCLAGAWAESTRHDVPLAFLMIDLDGFKRLNDEDGHLAGDEILRVVGRVLQANCRAVDVAARYGGDEFSVLLPHATPEDAIAVAERVQTAFREAVAGVRRRMPLSMSIGIAHVDVSRPVNAAELIRHADEAMYTAKSDAGGDAVAMRPPDRGPRLTLRSAS